VANVQLIDIDKRYDDVHVVRQLNLAVAQGEFLVLVGASGCGKSTTLRMVAGLESITGGTLRIGDRVVNDLSPRDRDIAMVFQSYALYPHMTVYENMAFGLRIRKFAAAEIDKRVAEAAALLGIGDLLVRKPAALSGGQRQRVAMGRAVVREPSVFLFDEPLSNLDAKLRVQMRLEIARLHKRLGATVLYVTHDQIEAMTLADRIAVMHEGWLQQCDAPQAVYNRPASTYVATFIGSPAMNLWPVDAVLSNDSMQLIGGGVTVALSAPMAARLRAGTAWNDPAWTLGVRPQDLRVAAPGEAAHATLKVEVVEPLGAETFAFGELEGGQAPAADRDATTCQRLQAASIVRLDANFSVREGDCLPLCVAADRLHLFDRQGRRIAADAE